MTAEPERIVAIENTAPDGEPITTSYLDFRDFRNNLRLVQSVTAYRGYLFSVGEAPNVERAWGEMASGGVFEMFGIKPEAGRFFSREEQDDAQNAHETPTRVPIGISGLAPSITSPTIW